MFRLVFWSNKITGSLFFLFLVLFSVHRVIMAEVIKYNVNVMQDTATLNVQELILWNLAVLVYMVGTDQLSVIFEVKFISHAKRYLNLMIFQSILYENNNLDSAIANRFFSNDIDIIIEDYLLIIGSVFYYIMSFVLGIFYLFSIHWRFTFFVLASSIIILLISKLITIQLSNISMSYLESISQLTKTTSNLIKNLPIIKVFRIERKIESKFKEYNRYNSNLYSKCKIVTKLTEIINDFGSWFILLGMYVIGVIYVKNNMLTIGEMFAAIEATSMITIPIIWLSSIISSLEKSKEVRRNLEVFFTYDKDLSRKYELNGPIDFLNVRNLSLDFGKGLLLNQVSLKISSGDKVMIIGPSGSGKSSLLKTMLGLNKKLDGDILYNGYSLDTLAPSYLDRIAYVSQENYILNDTIQNNITMFSNLDEEKLHRVISLVKLNDFIDKNGLSYVLDDKNLTTLSGGEKQRINIARALYHGGDVLFLDEAFSALDLQVTKDIHSVLLKEFPIVISVFHKYDNDILEHYNVLLEICKNKVYIKGI